MSSDRIPDHEKDLIEKVETGLRSQVVGKFEVENYAEMYGFFGSEKDTKEYLELYHDFFGEYDGALDYLEQWEDERGEVSRIIDSL